MAAKIGDPIGESSKKNPRPVLKTKLEGCSDVVNQARFIPHEDAVITVSDDRSIRVWVKRDNGQYWPSICHMMSDSCSSLDYNSETRRTFVGQDNGTISEFTISRDMNRLSHCKNYPAHMGRVTGIFFSLDDEWVLSVGRDKSFQWHESKNGKKYSEYQTQAWCTSLDLRFDVQTKHVFVGDYSGLISVLRLENKMIKLKTTLKGHSGSIGSLEWDFDRQQLYSGSFDDSVIVWDIGGGKGTALELHGHHSKVVGLACVSHSKRLFSISNDGVLGIWNMATKRKETPEWVDSDFCQYCRSPFFWAFKQMWDQKQIGLRQHHCRRCGKAVCDKCSKKRSTLPILGFEYEVRVCLTCFEEITNEERRPLALFHNTKQPVIHMSIDLTKGRLVTSGNDRIVKIWDVSSLINPVKN
ncbi:WD repeat and FYVE domain-containing protein 2-like isoform X2 [Xenia sp. Carnegie-2017]|uniref:WD repeat and FYVE domain-containing protein 2-like isoform X2 n=1 Tax=Xenia sp. Carnegie-2017 TaxID=2897299 RepID=UPI001F04D16A|nr:WD repeat and FYVE domain-containing protein 2-like isoform X2 [Xenia sp. Carnegie-2017]